MGEEGIYPFHVPLSRKDPNGPAGPQEVEVIVEDRLEHGMTAGFYKYQGLVTGDRGSEVGGGWE